MIAEACLNATVRTRLVYSRHPTYTSLAYMLACTCECSH